MTSVCLPRLDRVHLSLLLRHLGLQLFKDTLILVLRSIFLGQERVHLPLEVTVLTLQSLTEALVRVSFICLRRVSLLHVVEAALVLAFSRMHLRFMLLGQSSFVRLCLALSLLHLPEELLLLESNALAFKLDRLQFFSVLLGQSSVLLLAIFELECLLLVLLVDGNKTLQIALSATELSCDLALSSLGVFTFTLGHL